MQCLIKSLKYVSAYEKDEISQLSDEILNLNSSAPDV